MKFELYDISRQYKILSYRKKETGLRKFRAY